MSSYYKKNKEKILAKLKKKYAEDEEFREKTKRKYRELYQNSEEYKNYTLELSKNRYYIDPEYRKATIERARKKNPSSKSDTDTKKDKKLFQSFTQQDAHKNEHNLNEKEILLEQLSHFRKYYATTTHPTQKSELEADIKEIEKRLNELVTKENV